MGSPEGLCFPGALEGEQGVKKYHLSNFSLALRAGLSPQDKLIPGALTDVFRRALGQALRSGSGSVLGLCTRSAQVWKKRALGTGFLLGASHPALRDI